MVVLCTDIVIIGSELASALVTTGGASRSCGRLRIACDVLSRTSLAAFSRSSPILNSTVMLLFPTDDEEESDLIPSMPFIAFSSGSVICDSIISALAPV